MSKRTLPNSSIPHDGGSPIIITQNGEAKAVMQSIQEYDELQESLAMLKMAAMSEKSVANGDVQNAKDAFRDIWKKLTSSKERETNIRNRNHRQRSEAGYYKESNR